MMRKLLTVLVLYIGALSVCSAQTIIMGQSSSQTFCAGAETFTYESPNYVARYEWYTSAGQFIASGSNSRVVTINWSNMTLPATLYVDHYVTVYSEPGGECPPNEICSIDPGGPGGSSLQYSHTYSITITRKTAPALTGAYIAGPTSVALNCEITYSVSGTTLPAGSYLIWSVSGQGSFKSQSGNSAVIAFTGGQTAVVSVRKVDECGTSSPISTQSIAINSPVAPNTIAGVTDVCPGGTATFTAENGSSGYYEWTVPAGAAIKSGAGTPTVQVQFGTTPGEVSARVRNNCNSYSGQTSKYVAISSAPSPPIKTASAWGSELCPGKSAVLAVQYNLGNTYQWTVTGPAAFLVDGVRQTTVTGSAGSPFPSVTLVTDADAAGAVQVAVKEKGTCNYSEATTHQFNMISAPVLQGSIAGDIYYCPGDVLRYEVANTPGLSYEWSFPAGVDVQAVTPNASVVDAIIPDNGSFVGGTISVRAFNGCLYSAPLSKTITRRPAKLGEITLVSTSLKQDDVHALVLNGCVSTRCDIPRQLKKATLKARLDFGDIYNGTQKAAFKAQVKLHLKGYRQGTATGQLDKTVTLAVTPTAPEQLFSLDITQIFAQTDIIEATILDYLAPGTEALGSIRLKLHYEEDYEVDVTSLKVALGPTDIKSDQFEQNFSWEPACTPIHTYQLQMIKVKPGASLAAFSLDEERDALLLEVTNPEQIAGYLTYRLSLAEGTGQYKWRVRAIGTKAGGVANPDNWGIWSTTASFTYTQFEEDKNWIYSRTFTEGSRVAESLTFANGLLQQRQALVRSASQDRVIATQTLQDYSGRDALQSLPLPVLDNTGSKLMYKSQLLRVDGIARAYGPADFDASTTFDAPVAAEETGYYSGDEIAGSEGEIINKGVADAEGYAFTRTRFSTDGTNKVVEQSGVGLNHKIGSGRTVRTYYSSVAESELVRLFGKEAPMASKVLKIMTTDPNNSTSVTYKTDDGKVIATALSAATAAASLTQLEPRPENSRITERITETVSFQGLGSSSKKMLQFPDAKTVTIIYSYADAKTDIQTAYNDAPCKKCDHMVDIVLHNLDDASKTRKLTGDGIFISPDPNTPPQASPTAVLQVGQPYMVDLEAGVSYMLEKRITAFVTLAGQENVTYLDQYLAELETRHEAELQTGLWAQIKLYIQENKLQELYTYLNSNNIIRQVDAATEEEYYELSFGSGLAQTTIRIPYLEDSCDEEVVACDITQIDFEQYFNNTWAGTYTLAQAMPGYTAGSLNRMMGHILNDPNYVSADPQYALSCAYLQKCWQSVVLSYESIRQQNEATAYKTSLLESFWNCIGIKPYQVYTDISQKPQFEYSYSAMFLDTNDPLQNSCLQNSYQKSGTADLNSLSADDKKLLIACLQGGALMLQSGEFSQQDLQDQLTSAPDKAAEMEKVNEKLGENCEALRGTFERAVIASLHEQGIYVEGDRFKLKLDNLTGKFYMSNEAYTPIDPVAMCEVSNTVDQLVARCKEDSKLTLSTNADGSQTLGTQADFERLRSITMANFKLAVREDRTADFLASELVPAVAANPQSVAVEKVKTLLGSSWYYRNSLSWNVQKDNSGNIYVLGQIPSEKTAVNLGGTTSTLYEMQGPCYECIDYPDFFIVKFDAEGNYKWDRMYEVTVSSDGRKVFRTNFKFNLNKETGNIFFLHSVGGIPTGGLTIVERRGMLQNGVYHTSLGQSVTLEHTKMGYYGMYNTNGDLLYALKPITAQATKPWVAATNSKGEAIIDDYQHPEYLNLNLISATGESDKADTWDFSNSIENKGKVLQIETDANDNIYVLAEVEKNYPVYYSTYSYSSNGTLVRQPKSAGLSSEAQSGYAIIQYAPNKQVQWVKILESSVAEGGMLQDDYRIRMVASDNSVLVAAYTENQAKNLTIGSQTNALNVGDVLLYELSDNGALVWADTHSFGSLGIDNISAINNEDEGVHFAFKLNQPDLSILKLNKLSRQISVYTVSNPNGILHDIRSLYPAGDKYEIIGRANGTGELSFGGGTIQRLGATYTQHVFLATYDPDDCARTSGSRAVYLKWLPAPEQITLTEDQEKLVHDLTPEPCADAQMEIVRRSVYGQLDNWLTTLQEEYRQAYTTACTQLDNLNDNLTISYDLGYHHFTLYYYDRAGNLQRTVPPAGVELMDVSSAAKLATAKASATSHRMETRYKYNSLGQLVEQNTPDAGITRFYYNQIGQLRFSQNAEQLTRNAYSYTLYDALGRVEEVGESTQDAQLLASRTGDAAFPATGKRHVTYTIYSARHTHKATPTKAGTDIGYLGGGQQAHLLNRVSYTYTDTDGSSGTLDDRTLTYYSYDAHGNVEWLAQEIPGLGRKYIRYEYDLISGKVLRVNYQEGQADEFYHRYEYDADNRLTTVYTSADGQIWDRDAAYQYYAHGPLYRMELGEDRVQGLDYTYTIQGWLKGVNHPGLALANDPGKDGGSSGINATVGRDAFGMVLHYFSGDYRNTDSSLDAAKIPGNYGFGDTKNLFNGNIAAWGMGNLYRNVSNVMKTAVAAEHFTYDELNRIKVGEFKDGASSGSIGNHFKTLYSYDGNGNLKHLERYNAAGSGHMDILSYKYQHSDRVTGAPIGDENGVMKDNKLRYVTDEIGDAAFQNDVDNQSAGNYAYDAAGNLIQDIKSGISSIAWTPYGKVERITKTSNATVDFGYDAAGNRVSKRMGNATTYYVRDASGNIMANYQLAPPPNSTTPELSLTEQPIYGSSRLGVRLAKQQVTDYGTGIVTVEGDQTYSGPHAGGEIVATPGSTITLAPGFSFTATSGSSFSVRIAEAAGTEAAGVYTRTLERKQYELTDHLGNVRVLVSDTKRSFSTNTYEPHVLDMKSYYPFGQEHRGRFGDFTKQDEAYRYGYNGKEMDQNTEWGELTNYDYGFRIYNPGIARFLSIDPLTSKFPWYTPYQFAGNKPIWAIDLDGLEEMYYILTFDEGKEPKLSLTTATNKWYLPDLHKVFVPELGLSYTFMGIVVNGNYIEDFNEFKDNPVEAIFSGKFKSDQEIIGDAAVDLAVGLLMRRALISPNNNLSSNSASKRPDWLIKVREGVAFQNSKIAELKRQKIDFKQQIRLVPRNGKNNEKGNRTDADALIRNNDGTFTIKEYKLSKQTPYTTGQRKAKSHVENGNGNFEVRSDIPEWNLKKGDVIKIKDYQTEIKQ